MKRLKEFIKDLIKLGLNKKVFFITMFLYLSSVVFEAVGIFLLIPIGSLFLAENNLEELVGSQEITLYINKLIESFGLTPDKNTILFILILAILMRQIIVFLRSCWTVSLVQKLIFSLRKKAFSKFLIVKDDYFQKYSSGETINDITNETGKAALTILLSLEAAGLICIFFVYLVIMFSLSLFFTIFALISFLIAIIVLKKTLSISSEVGRSITFNNRKFVEHISQRFSNSRLLKLNGNANDELKKTIGIIQVQRIKNKKAGFLVAIINSCIEPIILLSGIFLLFAAIFLFNQSLVNLGVFAIILIRGVPMVKTIFLSFQRIEITWPSIKAVIETFKNLDANREYEDGKIILQTKQAPSIEFRNVSYQYLNRPNKTLKRLSFKIKAGSIVALVGPSGAGKSTIIDFIPRLKVAQEGEVFINGNNIIDISLISLRKSIGYLSQTPQIINGTIKDHISYGNKNLSDKEILNYLIKVNCKDLVNRLKDGIYTNIGSHGSKLSGGERQRLDLARVLAKESSILILDEPSSNLDLITEKTIQKIIEEEKLKKKKTIIVIGHRLNWFKNFDNIIVIKDGMIENTGNHNLLKNKNLWYKKATNI